MTRRRTRRKATWKKRRSSRSLCLCCCLAFSLQASPREVAAEPEARRVEIGVLPAIGFDSDVGLGLGAVLGVAKFEPGYWPYRHRTEVLSYTTFKQTPDGIKVLTFDDYIDVDLVGFGSPRLRFGFRLGGYKNSGLGYYGIGNASTRDAERLANNFRYHSYGLLELRPVVSMRYAFRQSPELRFAAFGQLEAPYYETTVYEGSRLEEDLALSSSEVRLVGLRPHLRPEAALGLLWDSRDHEFAPNTGAFIDGSVRSGFNAATLQAYRGANLSVRGYLPLFGDTLIAAARGVVDVLGGKPPVDELSQAGGLAHFTMTGGEKSVRGLPAQRLSGTLKTLANFELRARLVRFAVHGERFRLGTVVFLDAARVWPEGETASLRTSPLALHTGTGGGLRFLWGEAFLGRADFGWSPSEGTVGSYITIHHAF